MHRNENELATEAAFGNASSRERRKREFRKEKNVMKMKMNKYKYKSVTGLKSRVFAFCTAQKHF